MRFTNAARTGQGDQADIIPAKLCGDLPDFAFPADERAERQREEGYWGYGRCAFYGALPSGNWSGQPYECSMGLRGINVNWRGMDLVEG